MSHLPVPSNAREVGECIYCGAVGSDLGKEHAIPYGMNGPWTLLRASCHRCADITHRFERDTLRNLLSPVRAILAMQTRRPELRPRSFPLVLESNGVRRTVHVPAAEFPLYLPTPIFPAPGVISGMPGVAALTTQLGFLHLAGPTFEQVSQSHGAEFVGARLNFSPQDFARTLAKIAFTAAIYVLGIAPFSSSPIRKVILGEDRNVGKWVGSWTGETINEAKGLHAMQVRASGTDIHVVLRLFAQFGAPEYHVVLGSADPSFVRSGAWPW